MSWTRWWPQQRTARTLHRRSESLSQLPCSIRHTPSPDKRESMLTTALNACDSPFELQRTCAGGDSARTNRLPRIHPRFHRVRHRPVEPLVLARGRAAEAFERFGVIALHEVN